MIEVDIKDDRLATISVLGLDYLKLIQLLDELLRILPRCFLDDVVLVLVAEIRLDHVGYDKGWLKRKIETEFGWSARLLCFMDCEEKSFVECVVDFFRGGLVVLVDFLCQFGGLGLCAGWYCRCFVVF
ncbi:hypothetical protein HG530_014988 [Fusarium avenaceum]|nr:hypothetical protein HG530_014988 [Fusarium avenaceum]